MCDFRHEKHICRILEQGVGHIVFKDSVGLSKLEDLHDYSAERKTFACIIFAR